MGTVSLETPSLEKIVQKPVNKQVNAVIFDIDDTLLNTTYFTEIIRKQTCKAIIEHAQKTPKLQEVLSKADIKDPDKLYSAYQEIARKKGSNHVHHLDDLYDLLHIRAKGMAREQWHKEFVFTGIDAYHAKRDELINPRDRDRELIKTLQERDIYTGVVTCARTRKKQIDKLKYLGLRGLFRDEDVFVVRSDTTTGIEKYGDKSKGLLRLSDMTGIDSEHMIYVGDSGNDWLAAGKAGMRFIFYYNPRGKYAQKFIDELKIIQLKPVSIITDLYDGVLEYVDVCDKKFNSFLQNKPEI